MTSISPKQEDDEQVQVQPYLLTCGCNKVLSMNSTACGRLHFFPPASVVQQLQLLCQTRGDGDRKRSSMRPRSLPPSAAIWRNRCATSFERPRGVRSPTLGLGWGFKCRTFLLVLAAVRCSDGTEVGDCASWKLSFRLLFAASGKRRVGVLGCAVDGTVLFPPSFDAHAENIANTSKNRRTFAAGRAAKNKNWHNNN